MLKKRACDGNPTREQRLLQAAELRQVKLIHEMFRCIMLARSLGLL